MGIVQIIKEYNRYKRKRIAVAGIIVNILLWSTILFAVITFALSGLVENNLFAIILGGVFSFYLILNIISFLKNILREKTVKAKEKYNKALRLKRLYSLSESEFIGLALNCIVSRNSSIQPVKKDLFYMSGKTAIVFLILPDKKDIQIDKLNMAIKSGADNIIAVTREGTVERIRNKFGGKIFDIVTDADIAFSSCELDYDEVEEKKKVRIDKIFSKNIGSRLVKMSLGCIFPMMMPGLRVYFLGFAIVLFSAGIFVLIMDKKLH